MSAVPPAIAAPSRVETVEVLTHTQPEQTAAALDAALAAARERGIEVVAEPEEAAKHRGAAGLGSLEPGRLPDLCLVLGGDGTILQALSRYAGTEVVVFGINFGTVGFLAAAEREGLEAGIAAALGCDFEVMALPALETEVDGESRVALNDVSFIRRQGGRVAELGYRVGGQEVGHVRCDGLVAATPAGSTGYNLANGGPILAWGVEGFVVSFIAPHTLTARALVVAPSDVLSVRNAAGREPVEMVLDGVHVGRLESGAEVDVRFRHDAGRLAQPHGTNFYVRIREKFGRLAH